MQRLILISFLFFYSCDNKRTNNSLVKSPYSLENREYVPMPQLELSEEIFDFGDILQGVSVSHNFIVKNVGDDDLIIFTAKGSCGCTVPQWPKEPIAPGETGTISVKFNSKNKKGLQNKSVTITANTTPATTKLRVTGTIEVPE